MIIDFTHIIAQLPELVRSMGVTLAIWLVGTVGAVVLDFLSHWVCASALRRCAGCCTLT